jgi:serine/threonine protein phosphatase PrpC
MTSRDAHRQRFLINRLYAIGVLTVAAAIFGAIAAFLLYSDSGWDPATVGNQIIARNPGPCPPPGSGQPTAPQTQPQADGSFIPPFIRAQLAASPAAPDQTPVPCKPLMGALAPQGYYEQPVPGTGNWLQFQIDPPKQSPSRPTLFLVTFIAVLASGLVMLFWPGPAHAQSGQNVRMVQQRPRQPGPDGPQLPPTPKPKPEPPAKPPSSPARRVELAALTTSGVSGLTVDRGSSGPFEVYAATQVGLQHAKDGHTREDAYAIGGAPDSGWVFLAVADGLGSAENSHAAAQLASQTVLKLMRQQVPSIDPGRAAEQWQAIAPRITAELARVLDRDRVDDYARQLGYEARASLDSKRSSPGCTLVFASLGPVTHQGYPLFWGTVGDTELILVDLDTGQQTWLTHNVTKQAGGRVSNVTRALPRDYQEVVSGWEFVRPSSTMTVLASDGMADAIRQEPAQYAELLPQVTGPSPKEWMFGQLVGFDLPGLHDDRTLVAAWPRRTSG